MARINREQIFASYFGDSSFELYVETEITRVDARYGNVDVDAHLIAVCNNTGELSFTAGQSYMRMYGDEAVLESPLVLGEGEHILATRRIDDIRHTTISDGVLVEVVFAHSCEEAGITEQINVSKKFIIGKLVATLDISLAKNEYYLGDYMDFIGFELDAGYTAKAEIYINKTLAGVGEIDVENGRLYLDPEWGAADTRRLRGDMRIVIIPYCKGNYMCFSVELQTIYTMNAKDCTPIAVLSVTPVSENDAVNSMGFPIKNRSAVVLDGLVSCGRLGAEIVEYTIIFDGEKHITDVFTTEVLTEAGVHTWRIDVKDSRGLKATAGGSFEVMDYRPAEFTGEVYRADADGNRDASGEYVCVLARTDNAFIYGGANFRSLYYTLCKKAVGEIESEAVSIQISDEPQVMHLGLGLDESYDFKVICRDAFGGETERTFALDRAQVELNISKNALAVGKYATVENLFDCAWDAKINGNITFTNKNGHPISLRDSVIPIKIGTVVKADELGALLATAEEGLNLIIVHFTNGIPTNPMGRCAFLVLKSGEQVFKLELGYLREVT